MAWVTVEIDSEQWQQILSWLDRLASEEHVVKLDQVQFEILLAQLSDIKRRETSILKALNVGFNRLVFKVTIIIGGKATMPAKAKDSTPINMTDAQVATFSVALEDVDGNPVALQAALSASASDPTFGTVSTPVLNADGTCSFTFTPAAVAGKLGGVTISYATQSPDPTLTGSTSLNVTASAGTQLVPQITVA